MARKNWKTVSELLKTHKTSRSAISRFIQEGSIDFEKVGDVYLINEQSLIARLKGRRKKCEGCGVWYMAKRSDQKYHDGNCRSKYGMRAWREKKGE